MRIEFTAKPKIVIDNAMAMLAKAEKMGFDPEKLREFLKQQISEEEASPPQTDAEISQAGEDGTAPDERFHFDLKPEELEAYLDQYVIRQSDAKAILSTKICTHFNRLNLPPDENDDIIGNIKNNILMVGPTGVGKTYLIKLIARKIGVPFVKGDATKFSETGYVGGDVEDLVRELVREADGDIETAQYGIIYIDEIDKIAASGNAIGIDVSRSGVQRNLLKLMEETEVDLRSPHDLASQMESVMQMQRSGKVERRKINTRNILFIVSGAFTGLDDIISRRLNRGAVGFRLDHATTTDPHVLADADLLREVRSEDLLEFGFESEFVGRLPVVAVLDPLNCDDLLEILRNPKSSVILAKKRDFLAYGIQVEFEDKALALLAGQAHLEHTGARGLVSALEKALLSFEKRLPSVGVNYFEVSEAVVLDPVNGLDELLAEHSLQTYIDTFHAEHGIRLDFDHESSRLVKQMATNRKVTPNTLCSELLADYGHGLKLVSKGNFAVTASVLQAPEETLNALVKSFYEGRDLTSH